MRWIKKLSSKQSQEPESQVPEEETTGTQDNAPSDELTGAEPGSQATDPTPAEAESPDAVMRRLNLGEGSVEILPQRPPTEVFDTDEQLDLDLVQNVFTPMGAGQQQPAGEEPQTPPAEGPGSSSPNIIRRAVIQPEEEEETPTAPEAPQEETPRIRQRGAAEAPAASEISADISTAPETPRETAPRVRQRGAAEAPTTAAGEPQAETPQEQTPRVRQRGAAEAPTAGTTPAEIPAAPQTSQEQAPRVRQTDAAAQPEAPRVRQGETVAAGQEAAPRARQRVSGTPGSEAGPRTRQRGGAPAQTPATGSQAGTRPSSGGVLDSGELSLKDIFRKKSVTNPRTKALLERHGTVDVHELADELQDFARSITAEEDLGRSLTAAEEFVTTAPAEEKTE